MTETAIAPSVTSDEVVTPALVIPPTGERLLPWQGIASGTAGDAAFTSQQMLAEAGLDWEVGLRPYMRNTARGMVPSDKMFETYRLDTDDAVDARELGGVKSRYELLQNREAFNFGDGLIERGLARWTHAGMQQNGSKIFMTMLLESEYQVLGQVPFKTYLFISSSHDGARSLKAFVTPINVWCTNQTAAVKADNVGEFAIQHTASMHGKLAEAQAALQRAEQYSTIIKEQAELLAAVSVGERKARNTLMKVIPQRRPRRDEMISGIMHLLQNSPTIEGHRDNGWGLLNAVTEYMDHAKTQRNGNARYESITFGEGAKVRLATARLLAGSNLW
jgi:phage/plasmid-like protein (TIGR03299 family)